MRLLRCAVLLCSIFFFFAFTAFLRAVHVTDNSCSLVSSEFAVTVALPIVSFPPRFFLGWPKHSSEDHGKSDFRQNFDESEIAEFATRKRCLQTMSSFAIVCQNNHSNDFTVDRKD